jgi:hypothetical protein
VTTPPSEVTDRWPLLGLIAFAIFLVRGVFELSGMASKNLTGFRKLVSSRARLESANDERIAVLKESVDLFRGQVADLKGQLSDMRGQLANQVEATNIAHKLADSQGRSIRAHIDWDRRLIAALQTANPDFEFPDPPDLYVYPEETP